MAIVVTGLLALLAPDAKGMPQAATSAAQVSSTTGVATLNDRKVACPYCGQLACPSSDDLLAASGSPSPLRPADAGPMPLVGFFRPPCARALHAFVSTFPTSFEPRGPPFVD